MLSGGLRTAVHLHTWRNPHFEHGGVCAAYGSACVQGPREAGQMWVEAGLGWVEAAQCLGVLGVTGGWSARGVEVAERK